MRLPGHYSWAHSLYKPPFARPKADSSSHVIIRLCFAVASPDRRDPAVHGLLVGAAPSAAPVCCICTHDAGMTRHVRRCGLVFLLPPLMLAHSCLPGLAWAEYRVLLTSQACACLVTPGGGGAQRAGSHACLVSLRPRLGSCQHTSQPKTLAQL